MGKGVEAAALTCGRVGQRGSLQVLMQQVPFVASQAFAVDAILPLQLDPAVAQTVASLAAADR